MRYNKEQLLKDLGQVPPAQIASKICDWYFEDRSDFLPIFRARFEDRWPNLATLIDKIWDKDVGYEEVRAVTPKAELDAIEDVISRYPSVFKDGVPFPGSDASYDELLRTEKGAKFLQKMIDSI